MIDRPVQGQRMRAAWGASVADALNRKAEGTGALQVSDSTGGVDVSSVPPTGFFMAELVDDIFGNFDKTAKRLRWNDDSPSTPYFDPVTGGSAEYLQHMADPLMFDNTSVGSVFLAGERHLTFWSPAAAQRIPIPTLNMQLGKVKTSPITAGGSGTVTIQTFSSGTWSSSGHDVTAYDPRTTGSSLAVGHRVFVWQHRQSKSWLIIDADPCAA